MPPLSVRYCTWPALAFFTAPTTSGETVPTCGFGIRPRGPRIWPSWPTTRIASGVAITTSKSILPALMSAARSSKPTMSAPASRAFCALSPWANTATRMGLPMPLGSTTAPRTIWSDLRASTPRFTAISIDSSNLAVALSLTSCRASVTRQFRLRSIFSMSARSRLDALAISDPLDDDGHGTGRTGDGAHCRVHIGRSQIGFLGLGDFFQLRTGDRAHLVHVRLRAALVELDRLLDQHRR